MNSHQMMLNFCAQNFQTNEKMNVFFGHHKRICRHCGLPICRKNLDINDFLPIHRNNKICTCGLNQGNNAENEEEEKIDDENEGQNDNQNNQDAPINLNQNRIVILPQRRNQLNIIGNPRNQQNQENQRREEGALQIHQDENNNLLENEQIQEIPGPRVVPQVQNNNNNNIENQMGIVAPQVIENRQQNVNANFNPNNFVSKEEFDAFKNDMLRFKEDMLLFKNQENQNFAKTNAKLDDIYRAVNNKKAVQNNIINNNI